MLFQNGCYPIAIQLSCECPAVPTPAPLPPLWFGRFLNLTELWLRPNLQSHAVIPARHREQERGMAIYLLIYEVNHMILRGQERVGSALLALAPVDVGDGPSLFLRMAHGQSFRRTSIVCRMESQVATKSFTSTFWSDLSYALSVSFRPGIDALSGEPPY